MNKKLNQSWITINKNIASVLEGVADNLTRKGNRLNSKDFDNLSDALDYCLREMRNQQRMHEWFERKKK